MEIKIGIQHVSRELVIEVTHSADEIENAAHEALSNPDGVFSLTDEHGRKVLIPASKIGYVDIGEESARRVGFGTV